MSEALQVKFKPRDMVLTPGGRTGTVLEILPAHQRLVDIPGEGKSVFKTSDLTLLHAATPRRWREYKL